MNFTIENFDMGYSYIVRLEDGSCALVNIRDREVFRDEPESLMSMGFWADDNMEPVSEDIRAQIEDILKNA